MRIFWEQAKKRSEIARQNGALVPLETKLISIAPEINKLFEIRLLIASAPKHLKSGGPKINPFSPWDKRLEVASIGNDHKLILNKYPVKLAHMLLITKEWSPQRGWLEYRDWQALIQVDRDTSGLWFFNSCPESGASQPHRHLQLIGFNKNEKCPRNDWYLNLINLSQSTQHSVCRSVVVKSRPSVSKCDQAEILYQNYLELSEEIGLGSPGKNEYPLYPYNILITKEWISLIRRKKEHSHGFSINALGFAGYLLATRDSNLNWLEVNGAEGLLNSVLDTKLV